MSLLQYYHTKDQCSHAYITYSQFEENIIEDKSDSILFRFGVNGVISTIRLPLTFRGVNQFKLNIGGCINIINAKVDINGTVLFTNNSGAYLGGAVRIVGFSFVSVCMHYSLYIFSCHCFII